MGLFTPGWLKDIEKAKEKEKKTESLQELKKLVMETSFSGKDGILLWYNSIKHIKRADPSNEKVAVLTDIAHNAGSAFSRCAAAYALKSDEGKKIIAGNIAAAYRELGEVYVMEPADWIDEISDRALIRETYNAATTNNLKCDLAKRINDQELLLELVTGSDKALADAAVKNLRFTQEQCVKIIRESKYPNFRDQAIRNLDKTHEDLLFELAEGGNQYAKKKLLDIDIEKYALRYRDQLGTEDMAKAIDKNIFSEEELEKLAAEGNELAKGERFINLSWYAMEHISDPEILKRLLYRPLTRDAIKNNAYGSANQDSPWVKWTIAILEKLPDDENEMLKFILSSHGGHQPASESVALSRINDKSRLMKVALAKNSVALDAAKRLEVSDEVIEKLKGAEDKKVVDYANEKWVERTISNSSGEDAFKIMRIKMEQGNDPLNYLAAYDQLQNDEMRVLAYKEFFPKYRPFKDSSDMVKERMLKAITDGEKWLDFCIDNTSKKDEINKLRELISGTPLEQKMIDIAVKDLMDNPLKGWRMNVVASFYEIDYYQAVWKYGGQAYIELLMSYIEEQKEIGSVRTAADILKKMYQKAPESQGELGRYNGRKYIKHDDFHDEHCYGNNRNSEEAFIIKF